MIDPDIDLWVQEDDGADGLAAYAALSEQVRMQAIDRLRRDTSFFVVSMTKLEDDTFDISFLVIAASDRESVRLAELVARHLRDYAGRL